VSYLWQVIELLGPKFDDKKISLTFYKSDVDFQQLQAIVNKNKNLVIQRFHSGSS
jgi:hypothetical protein